MNKEEVGLILEKKGMVKNCREVLLNNWEKDGFFSKKISKEIIDVLIAITLEKGCKASCYQ